MSPLRVVLALLVLATVCVVAHAFIEVPTIEDGTIEELTALQTYVNTPDANYGWVRLDQFDEQGLGYKIMWLNMTSQRWLTDADVSQSIWWHFMAIIVPDNLDPEFAGRGLMYMTGGEQDPTPPKITSEDLLVGAILAQECRTVVTVLFQIPNQPILYWSELPTPRRRIEDGMIAYAWQQYLQHPDQPQWLPRLPMTKAGMRAMDAATEFWQQESGNVMSQWIVAGASKRGWTAWTVAACDPERVTGVIPMVLDELNFVKNIHHHWRAYGGWSFALKDYVEQNITTSLDSPIFAQAMAIVDPIVYADILTMPKLIISTGGDEFLLPDNNDYYWPQLQGEKHFHSFPNLEHSMAENIGLVLDTVKGFVLGLQTNTPRPEYVWTKDPNTGNLHVEINAANPPSSVMVWSALTIDENSRRDFRLVTLVNSSSGHLAPGLHPVWWNSSALEPTSSNSTLIVYDALMDAPEIGWIGFVIELVFPGANSSNFRVSSAVSILPMTFPYPDCYADSCAGPLV